MTPDVGGGHASINQAQAGRDIIAVAGDWIVNQQERPPLWLGVPPLPQQFEGRETLLAELIPQLLSGQTTALSAEGLPGVGKTTVAVVLAYHKTVLAHFDDGVLWASLGPTGDPLRLLGEWAEGLRADISDLLTMTERQKAVTKLLGQQRLLLVIDDAWEAEAAKALNCGGPNCVYLLTTRDKEIARAFAGAANVTSVPELAEDPAFTLLQKLAPEACAVDPAAARKLTKAVGGLPLALELLGGFLARPEHQAFADLSQQALRELEDPAARLALATRRLGSWDEPVTLAETIQLSLDTLPAAAVTAFHALGAFAPKPDSFSRLAAEAVTAADGKTLALLQGRNLVEIHEERLALHQTLADFARQQADVSAAQQRHFDFYLNLVDEDRHNWRRIEIAYPQISWTWRQAVENENLLQLLGALGIFQDRRGLWYEQLEWLTRGMTLAQKLGLRKEEGVLLTSVGKVYYSLGDRYKALDFYDKARSIFEEVDYQAGLAANLTGAGLVYDRLGRRNKALDLLNEALSIWKETENHAGLVSTLNDLGLVYDNLGRWEEALGHYYQALSISEEAGNHAGLAVILNSIGGVYERLGQWDKALDYYQQARPIREEVGDRIGLAATLNNIGHIHEMFKQLKEALDYYNQAHLIAKEVGHRSGLATTLSNIGNVYRKLGKQGEALGFLSQALSIREDIRDRPGQAITLDNIGLAYQSLGQWDKALEFFSRALPIREEVGDRAGERGTRHKLAKVYQTQGELTAAVSQMEKVVELDRLIQHPDLASHTAFLEQLREELASQKK